MALLKAFVIHLALISLNTNKYLAAMKLCSKYGIQIIMGNDF